MALTAIDPATGEQPIAHRSECCRRTTPRATGKACHLHRQTKATAATGTMIRNNALSSSTPKNDNDQPVSNTLDADLPPARSTLCPRIISNDIRNFVADTTRERLGLANYDVGYRKRRAVSTFRKRHTETGAQFTGQLNRTYRFYSIARDNAGNVESAPTAPDATTRILGPSAASVTIGGRVTSGKGGGVGKARVYLTDRNGVTRTTLTNPFGYYRFDEVSVGATYFFAVQHKRYQFNPQVLNVMEETNDLIFVALP